MIIHTKCNIDFEWLKAIFYLICDEPGTGIKFQPINDSSAGNSVLMVLDCPVCRVLEESGLNFNNPSLAAIISSDLLFFF